MHRLSLAVVASLALAASALASGVHSHTLAWAFHARCGTQRHCILSVARTECRLLDSARECRIVDRDRRRREIAHAARETHVLAACQTAACLQNDAMAMGDEKFGPGGGECVVEIITDHENRAWQVEVPGQSFYEGPFGLPQALPGTKMLTAGADAETNGVTQLRWMVDEYIPERWGTCSAALYNEEIASWY